MTSLDTFLYILMTAIPGCLLQWLIWQWTFSCSVNDLNQSNLPIHLNLKRIYILHEMSKKNYIKLFVCKMKVKRHCLRHFNETWLGDIPWILGANLKESHELQASLPFILCHLVHLCSGEKRMSSRFVRNTNLIHSVFCWCCCSLFVFFSSLLYAYNIQYFLYLLSVSFQTLSAFAPEQNIWLVECEKPRTETTHTQKHAADSRYIHIVR